jgi:hypothetical protein
MVLAVDREWIALENDSKVIGPGVSRVRELTEQARKVEDPGAEVAAVAFAGVDVAQPVAGVLHGGGQRELLTVGVEGIQVQQHVVGGEVANETHGLRGGVQQVALVAIDIFDADRDAGLLRLGGDPPQDGQ